MSNLERRFSLIAGLVAVVGVLMQAVLTFSMYLAKGWSFGAVLFRFLSFFTILTNLLIAIGYLATALLPNSAPSRIFARSSVRTGLFLYISVAAVFYAVVLSHRWNPSGWQLVANTLTHYITPAIYLLFWLLFVPGALLPWRLALQWLLYPAAFLAFILARGYVTGDYPYSFMMAQNGPWWPTPGSVAAGAGIFLTGGLLLVRVCRIRAQRAERAAKAVSDNVPS